jgi:hypothetical protein
LAVLLGALAFAAPALADADYTDATGEDPGSADITTIHVANSPATGSITFTVYMTGVPVLTNDVTILVLIDSDKNPATGNPLGADYMLGLDSGGWYWTRWNATQANFVDVPGASMPVTFANGVFEATLHDTDIGGVKSFDFGVMTKRGTDPDNPVYDLAPNDPPLYTYALVRAPAVLRTAVHVNGAARAGGTFVVTSLSLRLSTHVTVQASELECAAVLGGATINRTGAGGCTFALPKQSQGKRLVVRVSGSYGGATLTKTVAFKVA